MPFRGHRKQPPINHYYWAPSITCWPHELEQFKGNFYGPYFAYLMWRHQLRNVYITNLVKCKWTTCDGKSGRTPARIVAHCSEHYLKREVELFAPSLVLCFGRAAEKGFRDFSRRADLPVRQFTWYIQPIFKTDHTRMGIRQKRSSDKMIAASERLSRGLLRQRVLCPAGAARLPRKMSARENTSLDRA